MDGPLKPCGLILAWLLCVKQMFKALELAESKLREYYAVTDDPSLRDIYTYGIILAIELKS